MTIGESQNAAGEPAPEAGSQASPGTEDINSLDGGTAPEGDDNDTDESQDEPRTFTQEEYDRGVQKRLGIERRKWEREFASRANQPVAPSADPPKQTDFDTPEKYLDALSTWKAQHIVAEQRQREQQQTAHSTFEERADVTREKYTDYDTVVKNRALPITVEMAAVIKESDIGPEIAYHLGKNLDEAHRIASLSPLAQAREIGKLEVKLSDNPPEVKKVSNAPAPINPVGSRAKPQKFDTSDPKSIQTMGSTNWIRQRNADIAKRNKA